MLLTLTQINQYHKDSCLVIKNLCSEPGVEKLYRVALEGNAIKNMHWT